MKKILQTGLGILFAATITVAAASILKTRINEVNITNVYNSLEEIKTRLIRIEDKL